MGFRRKGREYALQILFQIDVSGHSIEDIFPFFWKDKNDLQDVRDFTERIVHGVREDLQQIDNIIAANAEHWRLNRMAIVDRNILRMAIYEFLFELQTPLIVIIDEAIEVAKKFGSEESGSFVNGILDAVKKKIENGIIASKRTPVDSRQE
ncbi:MAG: transcription antitermination factor NusB [Acidobacteriota bacterium]